MDVQSLSATTEIERGRTMAHLPKTTTHDDVIAALERFDNELRLLPSWVNWHEKKSQRFAISHDGKLYPPKQVIALATGCGVHAFSGGAESNGFLARRGFEIIALTHDNGAGNIERSQTNMQQQNEIDYPERYRAVLAQEREGLRSVYHERVLDSKMSLGQYQAALHAANDWRYLTVISGGMATRSKLDTWLMQRYIINESDARTMSNAAESLPQAFRSGGDGTTWYDHVALRPAPTWDDLR